MISYKELSVQDKYKNYDNSNIQNIYVEDEKNYYREEFMKMVNNLEDCVEKGQNVESDLFLRQITVNLKERNMHFDSEFINQSNVIQIIMKGECFSDVWYSISMIKSIYIICSNYSDLICLDIFQKCNLFKFLGFCYSKGHTELQSIIYSFLTEISLNQEIFLSISEEISLDDTFILLDDPTISFSLYNNIIQYLYKLCNQKLDPDVINMLLYKFIKNLDFGNLDTLKYIIWGIYTIFNNYGVEIFSDYIYELLPQFQRLICNNNRKVYKPLLVTLLKLFDNKYKELLNEYNLISDQRISFCVEKLKQQQASKKEMRIFLVFIREVLIFREFNVDYQLILETFSTIYSLYGSNSYEIGISSIRTYLSLLQKYLEVTKDYMFFINNNIPELLANVCDLDDMESLINTLTIIQVLFDYAINRNDVLTLKNLMEPFVNDYLLAVDKINDPTVQEKAEILIKEIFSEG